MDHCDDHDHHHDDLMDPAVTSTMITGAFSPTTTTPSAGAASAGTLADDEHRDHRGLTVAGLGTRTARLHGSARRSRTGRCSC